MFNRKLTAIVFKGLLITVLFSAPEEVVPLTTAAGHTLDDCKIIQFSDMPPGNNRYIMCSFLAVQWQETAASFRE